MRLSHFAKNWTKVRIAMDSIADNKDMRLLSLFIAVILFNGCSSPPKAVSQKRRVANIDARKLLCEKRTADLDTMLEQKISFPDWSALLKQDQQPLYIIGETRESPSLGDYPELFSRLKSARPEINCLFIEAHKDYAEQLNQLSMGNKKDVHPTLFQYLQVLAWARKNLVKIITVDNHVSRSIQMSTSDYSQTPKGIEERNKVMAQEISGHLVANRCKAGIDLVGAYHLTNYQGSESLPNKLKNIGIQFTTILVQETGCRPKLVEEKTLDEFWNWDWCASNPPLQRERFVTEPKKLGIQTPLNQDRVGKWNEFDYVVFFPARYDQSCKSLR